MVKHLLLQHWSGELNELAKLSQRSIQSYAEQHGADYQLVRGKAFRDREDLTHPALQKLCILNEQFDNYDVVVMTDMDMFVACNSSLNIFTDESGYGVNTAVQHRLANGLHRRHPDRFNPKYSYWGGSTVRLPRDVRIQMRSHINEDEIKFFDTKATHGDEGMYHRLATLIGLTNNYFPDTRWQYPSFEPAIESKAQFVHIRTKIRPGGPKRPKMENYQKLVDRGLLR